MRGGVAIGLVLMLAACDRPAAAPVQPVDTSARDRLRTMAAGERDAVFVRAIRDAGQACQHVAGSTWQRDVDGRALWTADCGDDGVWAIYVAGDGGAQVAACQRGTGGQPLCGAAAR